MLVRLGRQIYHPALLLPLLALIQLMIALDFNFGQLAMILLSKGMRYAVHTVRHHADAPQITRKCEGCTC